MNNTKIMILDSLAVGFDFLLPTTDKKTMFILSCIRSADAASIEHAFVRYIAEHWRHSILDFLPPYITNSSGVLDYHEMAKESAAELAAAAVTMAGESSKAAGGTRSSSCEDSSMPTTPTTPNSFVDGVRQQMNVHQASILRLIFSACETFGSSTQWLISLVRSYHTQLFLHYRNELASMESRKLQLHRLHSSSSNIPSCFRALVRSTITHCLAQNYDLRHVIGNKLLPPLLASVFNLSFDTHLCRSLLEHLEPLLSKVFSDESLPSPIWAVFPPSKPQMLIIESTHPYGLKGQFEDEVHVENALYLTLEFDRHCSLHADARLYVRVPDLSNNTEPEEQQFQLAGAVPIKKRYKTIAELSMHNWPQSRMIVMGGTVQLHFNPEQTPPGVARINSHYGFRCYIRAVSIAGSSGSASANTNAGSSAATTASAAAAAATAAASSVPPPSASRLECLKTELSCLSGLLSASLIVGDRSRSTIYPDVINFELFANAHVATSLASNSASQSVFSSSLRSSLPARCSLTSSGSIALRRDREPYLATDPSTIPLKDFYELLMAGTENPVNRFANWYRATYAPAYRDPEPMCIAVNTVRIHPSVMSLHSTLEN